MDNQPHAKLTLSNRRENGKPCIQYSDTDRQAHADPCKQW